MTREEFLTHEIYVWGEKYIFDLLDKGYSLTHTSGGWRWIVPVPTLDATRPVCYTTGVGVG